MPDRSRAPQLNWAVDENADGDKILCIDLPKKGVPSGTAMGAIADCIFDETLNIGGESILLAGLSQGMITMTLPKIPEEEARLSERIRGSAKGGEGEGGGGRGGTPQMMADGMRVDVSDLGLTMDDLEKEIPGLGDGGGTLLSKNRAIERHHARSCWRMSSAHTIAVPLSCMSTCRSVSPVQRSRRAAPSPHRACQPASIWGANGPRPPRASKQFSRSAVCVGSRRWL